MGIPGFPFSRDFRYPVVIIGTPFDCKRWERLMMRTALTVQWRRKHIMTGPARTATAVLERELRFFRKHRRRMRYASLKAKGYTFRRRPPTRCWSTSA